MSKGWFWNMIGVFFMCMLEKVKGVLISMGLGMVCGLVGCVGFFVVVDFVMVGISMFRYIVIRKGRYIDFMVIFLFGFFWVDGFGFMVLDCEIEVVVYV